MANTAERRGIPPEFAVAALVAAASLPLGRLFKPYGLGEAVAMTIVASMVVSWGVRRLNLSPALGLITSFAGMMFFIAVRYFPSTLWGPFPTGKTFASLWSAALAGRQQILVQVSPVNPSPELLMFVSGGVWLTVWLAHTAAVPLRHPLLAIGSTLPLFLLPGALTTGTRWWLEVPAFILAAAWILYREESDRLQCVAQVQEPTTREPDLAARRRPGWRAGTAARAALLIAVAVTALVPFLPGYADPPYLRSHGPGARIFFNPLVAIRPTLRNESDAELFTVRSNRPSYFRLTALDRFDGAVWTQRNGTPEEDYEGLVTLDIPFDRTVPVRQEIRISGLAGPWVPAVYSPTVVVGVPKLRLQPETQTLLMPQGLRPGMRYAVLSRAPAVTAQMLDEVRSFDRGGLRRYLELPRGLPRKVREIAVEVTAGKPTPFRRALALQSYLRSFTYDENVAAGHGFADIEEFLTKSKRGYCEQFAGSMAVMGRAVGLPTRVAIGFGSGGANKDGIYRVTTRQAHAWAEIYFPGFGWLAFEPTPRPDVAQVPDHAAGAGSSAGLAPDDAPVPLPTVVPTSRPSARPRPGASVEPSAGRARGLVLSRPAIAALASLGLAAALVAGRRSRRRRVRARPARTATVTWYGDFLRWCAAAGMRRRPGETPREHAARLASTVTAADESLRRLTEAVEPALWGAPDMPPPEGAERAAAEARRALSASLSRGRRALAWSGWVFQRG